MAVEEFVLQPSEKPSVAFQGQVIAQAASPIDDASLLGRRHEITVFETDAGDLHLSINFLSNRDGERTHCSVELGVQPSELADLLVVHDVCANVNPKRMQEFTDSEGKRFRRRLQEDYDQLCEAVEHQMEAHVPNRSQFNNPNTNDRIPDGPGGGWKSWLSPRKPR